MQLKGKPCLEHQSHIAAKVSNLPFCHRVRSSQYLLKVKCNIYDGEWIYIKNDMGRVKRKARITLVVKPNHIQTPHGWWMPEMKGSEPELFGVWDYQINQLIPGPQGSSSGFGGGQYKTTLVTLEKMTEGEC